MRDLLDRYLDAAPDLDTALDLAERLGWSIWQVDGSRNGAVWVMLRGPAQDYVAAFQMPTVANGPIYSNATFRSLYGAVLLALLRGLAWSRLALVESSKIAGAPKE